MDGNFVVTVFVCLLIPMLFFLGFLKGKDRTVFGYLIIGITVCLVASQVNTMILDAVQDRFYVITNLTPVSEEILKALPVLFFCFAVSSKAERIIPVAASVGIGFAIFENITILLESGSTDIFWVFCRGIGAGLMHAICTASVGQGMSIVGYRKRLFLPGTFSVLALAIIYHGVFNSLVETEKIKYLGICLPIVTYIPMVIFVRKRLKKTGDTVKKR